MYSSLEPVVKIKGTVIDLAEYSAYRYGYTFDGWYADEALTQRVTSVTLDADKTVYAAWTRNRFFEDVTIADWFYDDVMFVCGRGVMQGVSDTRFGPHLTATRAMMATILWRMEGSPAPTAEARFTDVRSGQWYSEAVAWTAQSGVYTGYADGSFRPNDSITREQLAAILYRYAKYKGVDVRLARIQISSAMPTQRKSPTMRSPPCSGPAEQASCRARTATSCRAVERPAHRLQRCCTGIL